MIKYVKLTVAIVCFMVVCFVGIRWFNMVDKLSRGQQRIFLVHRIADFTSDHDYRFPSNWFELRDYSKRLSVQDKRYFHGWEHLDRQYQLPWGESVTNTIITSQPFFSSKSPTREHEDLIFSKHILLEVHATNDLISTKIQEALESLLEAKRGS